MTRSETIAALDLGTNTIKLTVAGCDGDAIEEVHSAAAVVRIGKAIDAHGRIANEAIERAIQILIEFEAVSRELGATVLTGVATQAVRTARNGSELMLRIAAETGWNLRIISGEEEARLTFDGLRHLLPATGTGLIVDIGGGSTELILAEDRAWLDAESHAVGSGVLTDRFFTFDPPAMAEICQARMVADDVLAKSALARKQKIDELLLAGGSGQFLDALSQCVRRQPLSLTALPKLFDDLASRPAPEIARMISIPIERARVLPAGHQIAMSAVALFDPAEIHAVPSGIRAGIIARWCNESA